MLFNEINYILFFFPISVAIYFFIKKKNLFYSKLFLIFCSLFFYSYWNYKYLPLIIFSIVGNFYISRIINIYPTRLFLFIGIISNIFLLFFFKYLDFFIINYNYIANENTRLFNFSFPLALSFFTLHQIAYLVDVSQKVVKPKFFIDYINFVSFFPQLIAGPITYYKDIYPQFNKKLNFSFDNASFGIFIFSIGFFKKAIGDYLGFYTDLGFENYNKLTFLESWVSSLAFTFQLYFDFSGYTDMAIGSAFLFNIKLPNNFKNPLMANNLINFWQRWHITLTNFIYAYLYSPLIKTIKNLNFFYFILITIFCFLIIGIWHGPSWGFVFFGFLHGIGVSVNHIIKRTKLKINNLFSWAITFSYVNLSFIFFRSENLEQAYTIIKTMLDFSNIQIPNNYSNKLFNLLDFIKYDDNYFVHLNNNLNPAKAIILIFLSLFFFEKYNLIKNFKTNYRYLFIIIFIIMLSMLFKPSDSPFIYFRF